MTFETICIEQQEVIDKQSALIKQLLIELSLYRSLDNEEKHIMKKEGGIG